MTPNCLDKRWETLASIFFKTEFWDVLCEFQSIKKVSGRSNNVRLMISCKEMVYKRRFVKYVFVWLKNIGLGRKEEVKCNLHFVSLNREMNTWAENELMFSSLHFLCKFYGRQNVSWATFSKVTFSVLILRNTKCKLMKMWTKPCFQSLCFLFCNFSAEMWTFKNYTLHLNFSKCILNYSFVKIIDARICKTNKTCILTVAPHFLKKII